MPAASEVRKPGVLLPALGGLGGWKHFLAAKGPEALHSEPRDKLLWKGSFGGSVCKYPTAGEGLACALACPGGSDSISAQY